MIINQILPINQIQHKQKTSFAQQYVADSFSSENPYINKKVLVDGGVTHIIPIDLLIETGEKNILAINISQEYEKPKNTNIFEVTTHSFELMQNELKNFSLGKEKFTITPGLPKDAEMLSFNDMPRFIKAGYDSTIKVMPKLKQLFS